MHVLMLFSSTYSCEKTFPAVTYIKNEYRPSLKSNPEWTCCAPAPISMSLKFAHNVNNVEVFCSPSTHTQTSPERLLLLHTVYLLNATVYTWRSCWLMYSATSLYSITIQLLSSCFVLSLSLCLNRPSSASAYLHTTSACFTHHQRLKSLRPLIQTPKWFPVAWTRQQEFNLTWLSWGYLSSLDHHLTLALPPATRTFIWKRERYDMRSNSNTGKNLLCWHQKCIFHFVKCK